ncbi:hypothetical protein niasHT_027597 [Heterodera trifolii]|uniref:Uncharacterized protein n=1 Tax=Heterodera trifolii TaxID=157864 RepID=A0ABD2K5B8_9BILA
MPIWPCDLANLFSIFPLLFVLLLLANFVPPIRPQATCAFVRADFAHFLVGDTPDEPQIADDLSLCRPFLRRPSAVSCCTRQMEAKFEQFAREQLLSAVSAEIGLIHNFFNDWSTIFRTEFSKALNRTERTLRHIFQRTYGHFFTQNIEMFDSFFSQIRSLLFSSSSASFSSSSFGDAFRLLLHRIFLAEFALLNPMRSSDLSYHEQCLLNFFPAFAPFGSLPDAIVALHGRTFAAWTSFIDALDSAGEAVQSLGRSLSLSSHCVRSVVRLRFCPICLGHSPQLRPCPALCQNVFDRCLRNLSAISPHWEGLIDSLVRLGPSLASVHNPHFSLAPFPFQLSEAIMHFQENAKMLSGRILFRCFGDDLKKIATDNGQMKMRRRKRKLGTEIKENLEEEKKVEEEERSNEEEEEEKEEQMEEEEGQIEGEEGQQQVESVKDGVGTGDAFPSSASPPAHSSAPLLVSVLSLRRSIDLFTDRLLRLKGFWRRMGRMICEEGEIGAENVRGRGEKCWDGGGDEQKKGEEQLQKHKKKATLTREMLQMEAIAKRMRISNGMVSDAGKNGTERAAETANSDEENGQNQEEDVANAVDAKRTEDDYQWHEPMGKWWQWTETEEHTERNSGGRRTTEGSVGIGTMMTISLCFSLFCFDFLTQ